MSFQLHAVTFALPSISGNARLPRGMKLGNTRRYQKRGFLQERGEGGGGE